MSTLSFSVENSVSNLICLTMLSVVWGMRDTSEAFSSRTDNHINMYGVSKHWFLELSFLETQGPNTNYLLEKICYWGRGNGRCG